MRNKERGERIHFTLSKDLFAQFDKIIYINRYDPKRVLIDLVQDYVNKNQDSIAHYDKVFGTTSPAAEITKKDSSITNDQLNEAKKIIIQFVKDNQDKLINENEEPTDETIGIKLPSRNYIIVFNNKLNSLLDKKIISALKTRISLNGKTVHSIIKIEESELVNITEKIN